MNQKRFNIQGKTVRNVRTLLKQLSKSSRRKATAWSIFLCLGQAAYIPCGFSFCTVTYDQLSILLECQLGIPNDNNNIIYKEKFQSFAKFDPTGFRHNNNELSRLEAAIEEDSEVDE